CRTAITRSSCRRRTRPRRPPFTRTCSRTSSDGSGRSSALQLHDLAVMPEGVAAIERHAPRRRPEHDSIDAVAACPCENGLEQLGADASANSGLDVQVREISVAFAFADRIRHFFDQIEPDLADDPIVLDRDPGAPSRALKLAHHPGGAPLDERAFALGSGLTAGAELPAQR